MKAGRKISWVYSAITISLVVVTGIVFYVLSSRYVENLYFKYISEKAHAVAVERFEEDEMDPVRYRNAVLHRQNSIPTSHELFINMADEEMADNSLGQYLDDAQIEEVKQGKEVFFRRGDEVGTSFIYYDNEGTYVVVVLSRNPYGKEISRTIGLAVLILISLSSIVLYLISRLYAIKAVDRIDRNYQREKLFVNNASHEINNPLTAIQGECDIALMRERTPEEYRHFLTKISKETTRVIDIMRSLLQFSHAKSEKLDHSLSDRVDMALFMEQFASSEVQIKVESSFYILTDESLLLIAMRNLISNAIKYSETPPITVLVRSNEIEIKDKGIGIPDADLPHIFEPFYRTENSSCMSGHGIGLALSKEIIEKLGGEISVDSNLGEGTFFIVRFV